MAANYHIQELRDGLLIRVKYKAPFWEKLFVAGVAGAAIGLATAEFLPGRSWMALSILGVVLGFLGTALTRRAELRITNVEFITKGNAAKRYFKTQTVCTGDVRWLEFQKESNSEDAQHALPGLYAITIHGSECLLPFLSEHETNHVIAKIEKRFPGLADRWRKESPFGEHFLSLGIAKAR